MRRPAQLLLIAFVFAIPWEFSLELGEPFGPAARVVGILLLLAAVLAIAQAGIMRRPGPLQWLVLALFLWFCCSAFWTIDHQTTMEKLRGYFQEMIVVWLAWELVDNPRQLRWLLRAYVAGSWVLAALTLANFASPEAVAAGQVRFYAEGLDPNDTARFLDLAFPLAAVLVDGESRWQGKLLALGYFPLGLLAVLLTASRGGFVAAVLAVAGSAALLVSVKPKRVVAGLFAVPILGAALWWIVPLESLERLATIYEQLQGGNLNERVNIWAQGWQAFVRAPLFGAGAGSFVAASGLSPTDTAHNTALSIVVGGGLCALALSAAILPLVVVSILKLRGPLLWALATAFLVLIVTSLTAAVEESRNTWLLLALIAVAGRMAVESPQSLTTCFPARVRQVPLAPLHPQST